ncbi:hypothetical protein ABT147_35265 [Streptomyces sp. NPDC001868]|uniref:hypothetical protein n=1 Tax=Streptomyces sp. NPDC001868 TaxID=3154401 RepID=UPI00331792B4
MKQLELVIVQFEEVKRLIEVGRVPQLRLAFILLDSAVELIMHRQIQEALALEHWDFQRLENYRRAEADGRGNDSIRAEIKDLESQVTSNRRRGKIDRSFPDKIDFLVEKGSIPNEITPVLKRLHEYRNETYHRDHHRLEVIRPAVLIYFDTACGVLSTYSPGSVADEDTGPELERFIKGFSGYDDPFDLPERAANKLREEVGLDLEGVRDALTKYLLGRLDELEDNIRYVEGFFTDLLPGDAIRIIQVAEGDIEAIFNRDVMRSRTYPHEESDLVTWRERAAALSGITEKHALFTEFAAIEMSFEELEKQSIAAVEQIDDQIQMQLDAHRGK